MSIAFENCHNHNVSLTKPSLAVVIDSDGQVAVEIREIGGGNEGEIGQCCVDIRNCAVKRHDGVVDPW